MEILVEYSNCSEQMNRAILAIPLIGSCYKSIKESLLANGVYNSLALSETPGRTLDKIRSFHKLTIFKSSNQNGFQST